MSDIVDDTTSSICELLKTFVEGVKTNIQESANYDATKKEIAIDVLNRGLTATQGNYIKSTGSRSSSTRKVNKKSIAKNVIDSIAGRSYSIPFESLSDGCYISSTSQIQGLNYRVVVDENRDLLYLLSSTNIKISPYDPKVIDAVNQCHFRISPKAIEYIPDQVHKMNIH